MKAQFIQNQAPGGKREPLANKVPLETPFIVQFFPIYACNFTCQYCHFSIKKEDRCFVTDKIEMSWELYQKCIDEMKQFSDKIKTLRFVGMGEPLIHPDIARMVEYAKKAEIANRIEILTNGSLLTPKLSDALIAAGLDRMVISLQGVTAEKYEEISKIKLDFDKFVSNIRYFYEHKKETHMYLKVVDIALENELEREKFFSIFGDICDSIGIETASPLFPGVEYNAELEKQNSITQFGQQIIHTDICPQPFFTLQINPDGKVVGCYSVTYPEILGDCNDNTVTEIWSGKKYNDFRVRMLEGKDTVCDVCRECNILEYRMSAEDDISAAADRLRKYYEE